MLREIIKYFSESSYLSVRDVATHFGLEAEAVAGMLETLERKQKITLVEFACSGCSKSCGACDAKANKIYKKIEE
ncbi:MAG: FeoC-like transcriptional regulator [Candidatus Cloacimonadales bacterium]